MEVVPRPRTCEELRRYVYIHRYSLNTRENLVFLLRTGGFHLSVHGVGGMVEVERQLRSALASHLLPEATRVALRVNHTKGIVLHGPSGCGKTLIARTLCKMLRCQPKVVGGPEVLSKYIGQSEKNIRQLFEDARRDWDTRGADSDLHVIIFDRFDSMLHDTSKGDSVYANILNQLLCCIDGIDVPKNLLLIATTNCLSSIPGFLLKPGRFERHIKLDLPEEQSRIEILSALSSKLRRNGALAADVDFARLGALTHGFSGADIDHMLRTAVSFSVLRNADKVRVRMADFVMASEHVVPTNVHSRVRQKSFPYDIIRYGPEWERHCEVLTSHVAAASSRGCVRILLEGCAATGKSALAFHLAESAGFSRVVHVSQGDIVFKHDDGSKINALREKFLDNVECRSRVVILDDIERILEYSHCGQQHSAPLFGALEGLLKMQPPQGHRLLIVATTSHLSVLKQLRLSRHFDVVHSVGALAAEQQRIFLHELGVSFASEEEEFNALECMPHAVPVGKLIHVAEVASALSNARPSCQRLGGDHLTFEVWAQALRHCGLATR